MSGFLIRPKQLLVHRIYNTESPTLGTTAFAVNSLTYVIWGVLTTHIDFDIFPATHFRLVAYGQSNEAGQSVTMQLDDGSTGAAPAGAGNDLVIANAVNTYDSGWKARTDGLTGFQQYQALLKGSNATVDLLLRWLDVMWKID